MIGAVPNRLVEEVYTGHSMNLDRYKFSIKMACTCRNNLFQELWSNTTTSLHNIAKSKLFILGIA